LSSCVLVSAIVAAIAAAPATCLAGPCEDRCESSYGQCADSTAAGCRAGAALAGKVAEQLGSQIPIPGLGKLLGGAAAGLTEQDCRAKLAPCEQVRLDCFAECTAQASLAQPGAGPPPERKVGTLRVFSDQPRTRVYINDQRMGTTTDDPEVPFVSPELAIGKYWIRLITTDARWQWEGVKDLAEGNVNSIEGVLVDVAAARQAEIEQSWRAVRTLDERMMVGPAIEAYNAFVAKYPDAPDKCSLARERVAELSRRQARDDDEAYALIVATTSTGTRLALCQAYLGQFPAGRHRPEVGAFAAEIERAQKEPEAFAAVEAERDPQRIVELGEGYLATYPDGAHRDGVSRMIEGAREALAGEARKGDEAEDKRRSLRTAGGVTLGLGLASLASSAILGGIAWKKFGDLSEQSSCWKADEQVRVDWKLWDDPSYVCAAPYDQRAEAERIERLSLAADVLVGVGGALTVTGMVLLIVARRGVEEPGGAQVSLTPIPGEGAFVAMGWSY
jgi:hypothetical protein